MKSMTGVLKSYTQGCVIYDMSGLFYYSCCVLLLPKREKIHSD